MTAALLGVAPPGRMKQPEDHFSGCAETPVACVAARLSSSSPLAGGPCAAPQMLAAVPVAAPM
eukprot:2247065-Lingulodinium_polyedra.AAC.1